MKYHENAEIGGRVKVGGLKMSGTGAVAGEVAAVGRGLGHQIGADVSPSAWAVFYDDRAQAVFDPLGQSPGGHINGTASGVRHDQSDRLGLRQGARGGQDGHQGHGSEPACFELHGVYRFGVG